MVALTSTIFSENIIINKKVLHDKRKLLFSTVLLQHILDMTTYTATVNDGGNVFVNRYETEIKNCEYLDYAIVMRVDNLIFIYISLKRLFL